MATINTTEARAALPQLLDRVQAGEEVTITRHGRPVAVLVRPDSLRARRAGEAFRQADEVRQLLDAARAEGLPREGRLSRRRAEQLVAEVRAGREAR